MTAGHGDHSDLWDYVEDARQRLGELEDRVKSLEAGTPEQRQLQYEADIAMADAAEYDRHGRNCNCPYCGIDDGVDQP